MIDPKAFAEDFRARFGQEPLVFSAPGRVNLIGEHTDYNEGFVLPFAIDKRTFVGIVPRTDRLIRAHTVTLDKSAEFSLDDPVDDASKSWTVYIKGMAEVLRRQGIEVSGADILIDSDVPFGAGLSSSAALEVSLGLAMSEMAETAIDRRELALAGQQVEHEFVGVRSGIMDQFASALGETGSALLIDCRSQDLEPVNLNLDTAMLVICDSRVKHSLASSEYNRRREECEEGVRILSEHMPSVSSLRDVSSTDFERLSENLSETVAKRCRHVISENARTLAAVAAIRRGDLIETGRLMFLSHQSLQQDYEVSSPELDLLVDGAMSIGGVYGSRMTGGGFGGCTISLLESAVYDNFRRRLQDAYENAFRTTPVISPVVPSAGARQELL
jgi:galactokinase